MPKILKPLLAATFEEDSLIFPYICSAKIDGIRAITIDGTVMSRSLKPIRNTFVQECLSDLSDGFDGELVAGSNFQEATSSIMRIKGEPNFTFFVFDYVNPNKTTIDPYSERLEQLKIKLKSLPSSIKSRVKIVPMIKLVKSLEDLLEHEKRCLAEGWEGVILRSMSGTYKFGRSTLNDNIIIKLKRFKDAEAIITGFEEKMHNQNEAEVNELGHTFRSTSKDGLTPAGTLGTIIATDVTSQETLRIGTGKGLGDVLRQEIWNNQNKYVGKYIKYKYFDYGVKDLPRHPVFIGFRDEDDMS